MIHCARVGHNTAPDRLKSETTRNVETMKTARRMVAIGYAGFVTRVLVLATSGAGSICRRRWLRAPN